jgi:LacI family gluconate utilization system Gnt-I transcriptional repressor
MARYDPPRSSHAKITIDSVAKLARVSPITVSRALRNPSIVAESTRKRILQVVGRTGYVPDQAASSLASTSSRIVAVVIPRATNPSNAEMFQGLADRLEGEGLSLLLGTSRSQTEKEQALVQAVIGWRPAALVLTGLDHTAGTRALLRQASFPIVELYDTAGPPIDMAVGISNSLAMRALTERLWTKGYRSIAYIHVDFPENSRFLRRRDGFEKAMRDLGSKRPPAIYPVADVTFGAGIEGAKRILAERKRPDAVICTTDVIAIGAMFEFVRHGLRVPGDIAVAGFEDIELASAVYPSLTSVRVDTYQMGRVAAENIVRRLAGQKAPRIVDTGYQLVERDST